MTSQLISMSSSEIKGLQTTFSLSFFGAYKDSIVELVPGYYESSSSSDSSESSSSLTSESSLSTWRLRSTSSSVSSLSSGNSSSSSESSLNSSSSTSTTSDPCIEPEKYDGPLQVWSDREGYCDPSGENEEWCVGGPEGNYDVYVDSPYNQWQSTATVCEFGYPCPPGETVSEYIIKQYLGTWYLQGWAFNPHSTDGGEYAVELATFNGGSESGPYGQGNNLILGDTSYYIISSISPCLGISISDSGTGIYAADGMYTQTSYNANNKTPIFSNLYGWTIRFDGGETCGGKWVLVGPLGIYGEWLNGSTTIPPSGLVAITHFGLSEDTYAENSWSNCP